MERSPPTDLDALADRLRESLPDDWRGSLAIEQTAGVLTLRFRDSQLAHTLDVRWKQASLQSFRAGREVAFSYRQQGGTTPPVARYTEVIDRLLVHETALAHAIVEVVESPAPIDLARAQPALPKGERTAYIDEFALAREHAAGTLHQFIDASLPNGSDGQLILFLQNRCDQACEFCNEPRRPALPGQLTDARLKLQTIVSRDIVSSGAFDALLDGLRARSPRPALMVSGNDWTRHPARDAMLTRLDREHDIGLRFHGPNTAFADPALVRRVKQLPTLETVHLTLLSSDPSRHDAVTGTPGSGQRVLDAIGHLRAANVRLRLFTVLTRTVVEDLPSLLHYLDSQELRTSLMAFLPDRNWRGWDARKLMAPMAQLADVLARDPALVRRTVTSIDGLPHCAVPEALHDLLCPGGRGHQREPAGFAPACDSCRWKPKCDGVTSSYLRAYGDDGLHPARVEGSVSRSA